jgi:type IV pilus assembly protein PilV
MLGGRSLSPHGQNGGVKNLVSFRIPPVTSRLARRDAGFTLIEVLVALIVLVLGVLGAAAMTLNAVRDSKQSSLRSQASALAYEMSDLMRANRNGSAPLYQEAVFTAGPPAAKVASCWTTGCVASDMATNDYYEWNLKLTTTATGLPNGAAVICHDASMANYPSCDNSATAPLVVKLRWDEKNNNARGAQSPTGAVTTRYMNVIIKPY